MFDHYTFPSRADLQAELHASDRDDADLATLHQLQEIITEARYRVANVSPIRHPEARWDTYELLAALEEQLTNIRGERSRIVEGPLVLDREG